MSEEKRGYEKYLPAISEWVEPFGRIASQYTDGNNLTSLKFSALATVVSQLVLDRIASGEGLSGSGELDAGLSFEIYLKLVEELNGTLPLNHPFIVALCRINDSRSYKFSTMLRKTIPGFHDNLQRKVVPLLRIYTDDDSGVIRNLRVQIDFIGELGDAPEELF